MDKQTIKKIKEIVHKYDPEGFVAMDTPDGEYDDYISRIVSQYNDGRLMPDTLAGVFKEGNREIDYNSLFCEIVAAASESDPRKFGKQRIVQTFLGENSVSHH